MVVAICCLNMSATFDTEQKQYLEGFFSGVNQRSGMPFLGQNAGGQFTDNLTESVEDTVHLHDLHATMLHLLGLDHTKLVYRYGGRDFRFTNVRGNVVQDITT